MTKKLFAIGFLIIFLVSCSKVPITGRKQMRLLPESMMMSLSLDNYKGFLTENPALSASDNRVKQLRKVGNKLAVGVQGLMKEKGQLKRISKFNWEYNLVQNNQVNAWCMPGGKIVFYTGILPITKDETGLAVVMGHEMAHAVAKHGNERMSQQLALALGGMSLAVAMKEKPEKTKQIFLAAYGAGSAVGALAYSRKHEYEADKLGMIFMAKAGYDPAACVTFWERMATKKQGASIPEFLSTHPSDENRIKAMKEFLPEAKKYYKAG